jgi:hypothetical protein
MPVQRTKKAGGRPAKAKPALSFQPIPAGLITAACTYPICIHSTVIMHPNWFMIIDVPDSPIHNSNDVETNAELLLPMLPMPTTTEEPEVSFAFNTTSTARDESDDDIPISQLLALKRAREQADSKNGSMNTRNKATRRK